MNAPNNQNDRCGNADGGVIRRDADDAGGSTNDRDSRQEGEFAAEPEKLFADNRCQRSRTGKIHTIQIQCREMTQK